MKQRIAIIPARSGSKGLPNKNILMLLDKPLLAYTIEAAIESECFSRVIVSTDSLEYASIAEEYGAERHMRSAELSSDTATSYMLIEDILKNNGDVKTFALLQPTSPFRNARHIKEAFELFEDNSNANFLVSVVQSEKNSNLIKPLDENGMLSAFDLDFSNYRRQNSKEYSPNGAIFIGKAKEYLAKKHFFGTDSIAYPMNKSDSVDIDDRLDFEFAIHLALRKNKTMLLQAAVEKRIDEKFSKEYTSKPITLIGHSIFDYWDIKDINGMTVNNLGIAGINSEQYYQKILSKNLIPSLGNTVIMMAGTNDIVLENWHAKDTICWLGKSLEKIKEINKNICIFFLAVPPVRGRMERDNLIIASLNNELKNFLVEYDNVTWVSFSENFHDSFNNLSSSFTNDGLHFTSTAYEQLHIDLMRVIK